jgi:hypothetical protein
MIPNTRSAVRALDGLTTSQVADYCRYWSTLVPGGHREYYLRWLFAFLSVRSRWQANVFAYRRLARLGPSFSRADLNAALHETRVGLWRNRSAGIWQFHEDFWLDPQSWYPRDGETMTDCRDRLVYRTFGIRLAKVSFALEMAFPFNHAVVCLDVHILKLYGHDGVAGAPDPIRYREIEAHWCGACIERGVPPVIARHIVWDQVRGESSTRYWSHVFEAGTLCSPRAITSSARTA